MRWVRDGLAHYRGDHGAAEAHLRVAMAVFRDMGAGALIWYLGLLALNLAVSGKTKRRRVLRELERLSEPLPEGPTMPYAYLLETSLR